MPVVSDTRLSLSVDEFGGGGSGTIRVQEFGDVGSDDEMALSPLHPFKALKWPCISLREATQIAKCYANRAVENVKHTRPLIPSMIQKREADQTYRLLLTGRITAGRTIGSTSMELIRLSAFEFYNMAALQLFTSFVVLIATPSPQLLYQLLLSDTALSIELVCGLLLTYKEILEKWKKELQHQHTTTAEHEEEHHDILFHDGMERVALFNCFIWDFCSVLWRCSLSQLQQEQEKNSILLSDLSHDTMLMLSQHHHQQQQQPGVIDADSERVGLSLSVASLSITHGATFSGFASTFLETHYHTADHDTSVDNILSPDILTGTWKVKYLDYLKEIGFVNLHSFLTTSQGGGSGTEHGGVRSGGVQEIHVAVCG